MHLEIFMLWIILWIVFLIMSVLEQRGVLFGFLSGFWVMFLGVFLYLDGLQYRSGVNLTEGTGTCSLVYSYVDYTTPYSTVGMLWALPLILLGIYILYLASTKTRAGGRPR
jgi:uncharacterized protein YqgC (DUF456 family)